MRATPGLSIYSDSAALMHAEAEQVVAAASEAITARGRFSFALAGGGTPRRLYELLAEEKAATLAEVVDGADERLPVQWIRPTLGALHWLVDAAAAAQLRRPA